MNLDNEKLHKALKNDNLDFLKKYEKEQEPIDKDALFEASYYGSINILKYLIEELGFDINTRFAGTAKNTPFSEAACECNLDICKYLKEHGADLENLYIRIDQDYPGKNEMVAYLDSIGCKYDLYSSVSSCG